MREKCKKRMGFEEGCSCRKEVVDSDEKGYEEIQPIVKGDGM
jgi:hypothetical protein